jgi:ribosome-associated protein
MSDSLPTENSFDLPAEVNRAAELLLDRKAQDVTLLDLRNLSSATDFFLIATGRSDTHVTAIADHLIDELKAEGIRPVGVEGLRGGRWVLIDYVDYVVHVFHPAAREFYQLERLWGDAPTRVFEPQEAS